MIYGTYLSATGLVQAQAKQDVIANNLANAETVGFKRLLTVQRERPPQPDAPAALRGSTGGNVLGPTLVDTTAGSLEKTDRSLDVALMGGGFLAVEKETPAGERTLITRDGRLTLDGERRLVMTADASARVLDRQGNPITVPAAVGESDLSIDEHGTLLARGAGPIAELRIVEPEDPSRLTKLGEGQIDPNGPLVDARGTTVLSGMLETSNVDPTLELTRLIRVARDLEFHANAIRQQDTALSRLIEASAIA